MFKITNVKVQKTTGENGRLLGLARVVIDNAFVITDIRIIQGDEPRGRFVAFPSRKQSTGEFRDVCHPINKDTRKMFEDVILKEFDKGETNGDVENNSANN